MREIKFRGKQLKNRQWAFGYLCVLGNNYQISVPDIDFGIWWEFVDPKTVGQYTGLKDKNGTEIYEGDILEWYSPNGDTDGKNLSTKATVIWNGVGFDVDLYEYGLISFLETQGNETVKIIGNIHDKEDKTCE